MRKLVVSLLLLLIVGFVSSRDVWGGGTPDKVAAFSGVAPAKPPALPAAPEGALPGLALKFESGGKTDFRVSRLVALHVPAGKPATPFLQPGAFKATFTGDLTLRFRMENSFSAQGRGALKVTINDEVVFDGAGDDLSKVESKPAKLKRGKNKVVAEYTSPNDGDAIVRLLWSSKEFIPESVPPTMLTHEPAMVEPLREHARVREGRTLFATLRCTKCHAGGESTVPASDAMAELSMDAPNLADAGSRLNAAWVAQWVNDPKTVRPDASMPKVLHGDQAPQQAADIAAYLTTLGAKAADAPEGTDEQAAAGARLFANLGCVGCHTIPPDDATDAPLRRSLKYVKQKYQPSALVAFLKAPEKHYAWIRMPNFHLSDEEAIQLSAFLLSKAEDAKGDAPAGDADRGKALFASTGCASCHTGVIDNSSKPPAFDAIAKSDWTKGCPAPSDDAAHGDAPDFRLNDDQRGALLAFAASGFDSLARDEISEAAERQVAQLSCVSCHVRDKQQDVWSTTIKPEVDAFVATLPPEPPAAQESELAPDQARPNLTYVGEKLKPEWMAQFIAGKVPYKPRPWIFARMPAFPARAELLAQGLAAQHGCTFTSPPPDKSDPELAAAGKKLAGRNGGFSCNQCHSVGSAKAHAAFEAPAPNFAHVTSRLRDEFYHRWVRNPQRVEPGTRMPSFADGDGKTAIKEPFDGDATKQYEAIRHYLLEGEAIQPAE